MPTSFHFFHFYLNRYDMQAEKQWEIFIKEDPYSLACVKVIFLTNLNATQLLMFLLLSNLQKIR